MELNPDKLDTLISLLQSLVPVIQQNAQPKAKKKTAKKATKKVAKKKTAKKAVVKKAQKQEPEVESEDDAYTAPTYNMRTRSRKNFRANNERFDNKFDRMAEAKMHKEDSRIDKLLNKFEPVARMREATLLDVVCRKCGKKETVSTKLLDSTTPDRYKCNDCSTTEG